jgi:K+-sensing histidine kinase KdpD
VIVRGLIEVHGGNIGAEIRACEGARFYFTLR